MEAKPRNGMDGMGIGMITSDRDSEWEGLPHDISYIHAGAVHSYPVVDPRTAILVHTLPILKHR